MGKNEVDSEDAGISWHMISHSMLRFLRNNLLATVGVVLLLSLGGIGLAQYRWITRASEADLAKQKEDLRTLMLGINEQLELALREPLQIMRENPRLAPGAELETYPERLLEKWERKARRPELVTRVSVGGLEGFYRSCSSGSCAVSTWPRELSLYREMLERRMTAPDGDPPLFPRDYAEDFLGADPILVFPLVEDPILETEAGKSTLPPARQPRQDSTHSIQDLFSSMRARPSDKPPKKPELIGWCFISLNPQYLEKSLLPELLGKRNEAGKYLWSFSKESSPESGEASLPVFAQRVMSPQWNPTSQVFEPAGTKSWRIVFKVREGSIDQAVARTRRLSLLFSTAAIVVLAGAILLVLRTAERARRLSRQQMEFVASISHELRTPLAVIKSTSFNLASGRVEDPHRVQQYGDLIQKEVQRLNDQVDQVMAYAGIETGGFKFQSVSLAEVLNSVLADFENQLKDWKVEALIPNSLPRISGDVRALESVFRNIVQNAIKYASEGRWLGVRIEGRSGQLEVVISDHGPGIEAKELKHIFEPFYRSSRVLGSAVPGTGLGLSIAMKIIEAHGGTIKADCSDQAGTRFIVSLPLEKI